MRSARCLGPKYWYLASALHTTSRNFSRSTDTIERFLSGFMLMPDTSALLLFSVTPSASVSSFFVKSARGANPIEWWLFDFLGGISCLMTSKTSPLICQKEKKTENHGFNRPIKEHKVQLVTPPQQDDNNYTLKLQYLNLFQTFGIFYSVAIRSQYLKSMTRFTTHELKRALEQGPGVTRRGNLNFVFRCHSLLILHNDIQQLWPLRHCNV